MNIARETLFPSGMLERCVGAHRDAPAANRKTPRVVSPLPGLQLLGHPLRTEFEASVYQPVVCVVLQGRKRTTFGAHAFDVGAGDCLLVSHDLPVVSRIVEAPYLALLYDVSLATLRGLHDDLGPTPFDRVETRALEVHPAPQPLLEALSRLVALADSPMDAKVLGPLIAKEIHYRLLTAPYGGMLRDLLRYDSAASAVATAIAEIRRRFREPLVVGELARTVGMSTSAFHRHFKAVTAASPLQYQKDLRLLDARRLLRAEGLSVSTAAYEVGYESPNQFSREYTRKFGRPPKHDARRADPQRIDARETGTTGARASAEV